MIYIISRLLLFNSAEIANLSQQEKKKQKTAISHQRRLESPQGDAWNTLTFTLFFFQRVQYIWKASSCRHGETSVGKLDY